MTPSTLLKTSTGLLAASALAGCIQLAPSYVRPAAPVPATFPNATSVLSGTAAADLAWQDYFADPALRALIELALKNNRDLRVAVLNIEAVRAQYQLRRADQLPTLNAGLTASRAPGTGGNNVSAYSAGLSVAAYEVDLFGRVRSLTDSAAAQVLASEESRRVVQISLIASVANQYLALAADEELLDLTLRTLDTREQSLKLTQLRFDNGAASELDLRQAQTLAEAARVTLAQQRRQRELDRNALALLLGQALPEWPAVPGAAFWPRITLTASAGTASTQLSDLFKDGAWSFAAQLLQPIFDAGRNRANLAVAEVQRDIAVAQYERAIQAAFRDVADALAGRATLDDQVRATQAQADAEQARYRLSELRFRNGVSSSLELLDAERSLFAVQQAVVQTQLAFLQNRVSAYRALGGGNLGAAGQ